MKDKTAKKPADKMTLKVKKRDGKVEDFSREKLLKSLRKAGMVSKEKMEKIADTVTMFVKEAGKQGAVETSKIKGRVIGQMRTINSAAADKFAGFKKKV